VQQQQRAKGMDTGIKINLKYPIFIYVQTYAFNNTGMPAPSMHCPVGVSLQGVFGESEFLC
jgi:hypothetical protein